MDNSNFKINNFFIIKLVLSIMNILLLNYFEYLITSLNFLNKNENN